MNNTDIVSLTNDYTNLADFNLADALTAELGGMNVSFDRVTIPAAGGAAFEVPGENPGDTDMVKDFSGVILYHHPLFSYYKDRFNGSNNAPDCGSYDGITGTGNPGGSCAKCPLNAFGSGENGVGKACKNKRRVFILRAGELIPILMTLPTGSMKEFANYVKRLLGKGKKTSSVVTKFSLQKVTNTTGVNYSKCCFSVDRALTKDEIPYINAMAEQVKTYAMGLAPDARVEAGTPSVTANSFEEVKASVDDLPF